MRKIITIGIILLFLYSCKKENKTNNTKIENKFSVKSNSKTIDFIINESYLEDLGILKKGISTYDIVYEKDIREYIITFTDGFIYKKNIGGFENDSFSNSTKNIFNISINSEDTNKLKNGIYKFKLNQNDPSGKFIHYPNCITDFNLLSDIEVNNGTIINANELFEADSGYINIISNINNRLEYDLYIYSKEILLSSKNNLLYIKR